MVCLLPFRGSPSQAILILQSSSEQLYNLILPILTVWRPGEGPEQLRWRHTVIAESTKSKNLKNYSTKL
jgi:hypothetical protein